MLLVLHYCMHYKYDYTDRGAKTNTGTNSFGYVTEVAENLMKRT